MFICHRVNTLRELKNVPIEYGVEVDLRDDLEGNIYIQHDPFIKGESFEEYLKYYNHAIIILNIKSEGIEHKVLELMDKYKIENYFLLDCSFPMLYKLCKCGENKIAQRFSEFENVNTSIETEWIWVDCFNKLPINRENYKNLKRKGYKLCLVSPELQSRNGQIESYKEYLEKEGIVFDAICTKIYNIERWK